LERLIEVYDALKERWGFSYDLVKGELRGKNGKSEKLENNGDTVN